MLPKNIFAGLLSCILLAYSVGLPGVMGWYSAREVFEKNTFKQVKTSASITKTQSIHKPSNASSTLTKTIKPTQPPIHVKQTAYDGTQKNSNHQSGNKKWDLPLKSNEASQSRLTINDYQFNTLVRIISAEAKGETLEGQVAVGAVIINRVKSGKFPDTIAKNVFKSGQFEPVSNGQIWAKPTDSAYKAAKLALNGWDPSQGALYFFNPKTSTSRWIWSRPIIKQIGDHVFAS